MTEKLYYKDAYIKEFEAEVLECEKCDKGYDVVLDKTAFFPEEGGQYSDTGTIGQSTVLSVYEKNLTVHHVCSSPLQIGKTVHASLNFDERFENMQCHTAEHILSGLFYKHHGLTNVGFHLGKLDVTMDISAPLTRDELDKIERQANEIVFKNVKVTAVFPSPDELENMSYRSKLDLKENVRIVLIGDYDACACCAPHVSYSGEIGLIKILDAEKLRGGMRLHISAGRRALALFDGFYKTALKVSDLISTPKKDLAQGVENLLTNLAKVRADYEKFRTESYLEKAEALEPCEKNAVLFLKGAGVNELREAANRLSSRVGGYLVLLGGTDGNLQYVISTDAVDIKDEIAQINEKLSGRGGGRGNMAFGSFMCSVDEVKKYFI